MAEFERLYPDVTELTGGRWTIAGMLIKAYPGYPKPDPDTVARWIERCLQERKTEKL